MLLVERLAGSAELATPHLFAAEIPAAHLAGAVEEPDVLAVRHGRPGGRVAVGVHKRAGVLAGELHGPEDLAGARVQAVAQDRRAELGIALLVLLKRRQEEAISPGDDAALAEIPCRGTG